jgi:hypothetical protein
VAEHGVGSLQVATIVTRSPQLHLTSPDAVQVLPATWATCVPVEEPGQDIVTPTLLLEQPAIVPLTVRTTKPAVAGAVEIELGSIEIMHMGSSLLHAGTRLLS